jgi:SAM-dependent methyltransferase
MAHLQQKDFVSNLKYKIPTFFKSKKVLEVGSLNINGTVRDLFETCEYIGIDLDNGPDVDVVCEGQKYDAPDDSFDVVCSLECFEHNPYWEETFLNMVRMCRPGGLVFFTCATEGRPEHGTARTSSIDSPFTVNLGWDYYRNLTEQDFKEKFIFEDHFEYYYFSTNEESHDLYFYGILKNTEKELKPIPVIGVPIVNGFKWIQRLISSIDYPVDELVILNNNGRGELTEDLDKLCKIDHYYIKSIKVCHLPTNIGVSGAWNMIIKCYINVPYWIITNHDIAFTSGFLKNLVNKAENTETGIVLGHNGAWDIFLLKDWVVQNVGLFDENLYPAYVEDCDYFIRSKLSNIKIEHVDHLYFHGEETYKTTGSQTWRVDETLYSKLHHSRILNENWYIYYKWGPEWHINGDWTIGKPYSHPFNDQNLPLTYTYYNLDFVRKKHLGF